MDYFTKNKMLFWCVIILVLVNVVTLTSFWMRKPPMPLHGGLQMPGGGKIMQERLQLSPEQAEQFQRLREEHFARVRPLQDQMHKIRLDLLNEIFAPQPDQAKIEQWCSELGEKETQFERNLYRHFEELKAACNPQQINELKMMLRDLVERTRPRDPQRRPQDLSDSPGRMPPRP